MWAWPGVTVVQGFGCRPLDGNLLESRRRINAVIFLPAHPEVADLQHVAFSDQTVPGGQVPGGQRSRSHSAPPRLRWWSARLSRTHLWMQFLLSRYAMPAAASTAKRTSCFVFSSSFFFLRKDRKSPPGGEEASKELLGYCQ